MTTDGELTPSPAGLSRKSLGSIVNVWRLSTSASQRFSRSNAIRNRPVCNTLWPIVPFISAGHGRASWWSMTISAVPGATIEGRLGFQRLVAEVGLGRVGLVLGVEMSRLARSNRDWHQLLEICALFDTLIADVDGVYDPAHFNDRLLLGLNRMVT